MPAQDDARENHLVALFNLERPENRVRHGVDAMLDLDGEKIEFELKSITTKKGGLTTVRDFGRDHIEKWRTKHWIVAIYQDEQLIACRYGSPDAMKPWVDGRWAYIQADFLAAEVVPQHVDMEEMEQVLGKKDVYTLADAQSLHKLQYSIKQYRDLMDLKSGYSPQAMLGIFRDRIRYVMERGSTLNNPKVPQKVLDTWATITKDHAAELRKLVRAWKAASET